MKSAGFHQSQELCIRMRTRIGFLILRYLGRIIVPLLCWWDFATHGCSARVTQAGRAQTSDADKVRIVIVTPRNERECLSWEPGGGNYFFEIAQSAKERFGETSVSLFLIDARLPHDQWHRSLIDHLNAVRATHCIGFVESDPGMAGPWHWHTFAALCRDRWHGTFIGILTDGVYLLHQMRAARMRFALPRSVFVAIDMTPQSQARFVPRGVIAGPCFLPISKQTVQKLGSCNVGFGDRNFDVVFVGKVYENRKPFLKELAESGLRVGINPHRTATESRPGYPEYVSAMRQGYFTINLATAGGMPVTQLKSRVLEGPLFGTIVCSDERDLAKHFFQEEEFVTFDSAATLEAAVRPLLNDRSSLLSMMHAAHARASDISTNSFWESVDATLCANNQRRLQG